MLSNADFIMTMMKDEENNINPKKIVMESTENKESAHIMEGISNVYANEAELRDKYSKFISEAKAFFVTEAIDRIFNEASEKLMLENPRAYRRNLVKNFVASEGADRLLHRFRTSSELLSETALIISKYMDIVKEEASKDNCNFKLNDSITDNFYKDIDVTDINTVTTAIKDRVSAAMDDFITKSMEEKIEIKDALNTAKRLTKAHEKDDESVKESFSNIAKRRIAEVENTVNTNIYGYMVNKFAKNVITSTNESYKNTYMEGARLNMKNISETCKTMYTFLETLNTARIKSIDEDYIRKEIINN